MRKHYFVAGLCCVLGIVLIILDRPTFGVVCVGGGIAAAAWPGPLMHSSSQRWTWIAC
mgnify:CR=1 FL=1